MNKLLKNIKKVVSIMLVMSMIFTSHAFVTFAEGVDNAETTTEETTMRRGELAIPEEETTVRRGELAIPEEETTVEADTEETTVGENIKETTVGSDIIRPEDEAEEPTETIDYVEEPEEDVEEKETTTEEIEETTEETTIEEIEETTIEEEQTEVNEETTEAEEVEIETAEDKKIDNNIYGDDDRMLDRISELVPPPVKNYYVGDKYDLTGYEITAWYDDDSFENIVYADNKSRFTFEPDYVNNPFDASTPEGEPIDLTITYTDTENRSASYTKAIQVHPAPTTTYTVQYNQNLPAGYTLSGGMTWYTDSTTTDLTGSPIILKGSDDMTCEDTSGNVRTLQGWNAQSELAGNKFNFGDTFNDPLYFDPDPICTLYAMWSDPVAPGPTAFAYWIVTGDGDNKTIHYYATPGTGRTAVVIGTDGIEYTGLETSEKVIIKKAVIEEPIVATDVRSYFKDFKGLGSITNLGNLDTSNATSFKYMFEHCEAIKKIETSGLETDSLTDTSYMFTYCNSATDIILGDNFDTSNVTSMREMFNTTGAVELDLTKFETSKVTDMYGMFSSCENLETIRVSDKFVVDKVSTSSGKFMFANCDKLVGEKGTKIADLSSPFGVAYAHIDEGSTNPGLFSGASTPPTADWYWYLEGNTIIHYTNTYEAGRTPVEYDTNGAVVYNGLSDSLKHNNIETAVFDNKIVAPKAQSFFKEFLRLKTITDITNLDTSTATNFKEMFASCGSLETLDVSSLNTSNATDMESMFQWCNALTSLDVSNLDTSKVTNMVSMFNSCKKIEELDLTSFKTSNVKSMAAMFTNCVELTTIKTTVDFVVDQVTDLTYNNLFEGNTKLVGGQGTTYDASKLKKEYARIDEGPTKPGYFTGTIPPTTTYTVKYNQDLPTGYTLSGGMTWYTDSTTTDLTGSPIILKGSADMTCEDTSGNTRTLQGWNTQPELKGNKFNFGDTFNDSQYFDPDPTCTLYAMWSDPTPGPTPPGPTPPGPTPPGPTPPSPGGGGTGGGTGGGSSDPTHGPLGDISQNPEYGGVYTENKIPQSELVTNNALAVELLSIPENANRGYSNARDVNGNTGYGQWLKVPNTHTWYFLSGSFTNTTETVGFLSNGWFNLGWKGKDEWYYFDASGVMQIGWHQEGNFIYYLEEDFSNNWYGKVVTGKKVINGKEYTFASDGKLIP